MLSPLTSFIVSRLHKIIGSDTSPDEPKMLLEKIRGLSPNKTMLVVAI